MRLDLRPFLFLGLFACAHAAPSAPPRAPSSPAAVTVRHATTLDALALDTPVDGFEPLAVFVDGEDRARGARFIHARTRFVFDYLAIESAPQAMIYVTTFPTSDAGEPHTQEHLLLGKGNKGRYHGNFEHVMLAESSAFTAQYRTTYHFMTSAGVDGFWDVLRVNFDTLLHPDYSDEEIRREVRDFGIAKEANGALSLDEKGTVYNEMVRTLEQPNAIGFLELNRLVYGPNHPLAFESGGTPEGIRELTPAMIRRFHADHYVLGNMGMVGAFPSSVSLSTVLARVGATLDSFASGQPAAKTLSADTLPAPHGSAPGAVRVAEYPFATADHASLAAFAWPATRNLEVDEKMVMDTFLAAFGGGEGSNLYKAVVDRKTRVLDVGATNVWTWSSDDQGQVVYAELENVSATHADEASLRQVRETILAQLRAVAELPDGSKELAAFGERVKARVVEWKRYFDKLLDTPPEFGVRGTGDSWITHLTEVMKTSGFRKSLVRTTGFERATAAAESRVNPWRDRVRAWGLLDEPYAVATRASPERRARLDRDRDARVSAELARLAASYGVREPKETLARRAAEIDRATDELARAEASVPMPPFVRDPPMSVDDSLAWKASTMRGVPVVRSTFETMKSATVGLALRLDDVPDEALPLLAVLPALLRDSGVIRGGKAIPYDEVRDSLRREVLSLQVYLSTSFDSGRAELVIQVAGNDPDETRRAMGWMRDVLGSPDWRPENLPRLRDVVEQEATRLHDVMSAPEEHWVESAADAFRRQDRRVLAHAGSFLTAAHDARRLAWKLAGDADAKSVARALTSIGDAGKTLDRASLGKLAAALAALSAPERARASAPVATWIDPTRTLPPAVRARLAKAGRDLGELLADTPDASLAADWKGLCTQMAADVQRAPASTLDSLGRLLGALRHATVARAWIVGSSRHQAAIDADADRLLASLDTAPVAKIDRPAKARVADRARSRGAVINDASFVALINPSTANGAIVHSRPVARYEDTSDGALVDLLAANVFGGSGTHSVYKRVWGAGLAYSGYVHASPRTGRMLIYSDRCADVPQLLRFLDGEVRHAPADPRFVDYALAPMFGSRVGDAYERRGGAMAIDLVEGRTPDVVRNFRTHLLAVRARPALAESMRARLAPLYAPLLPSLAPSLPVPPDTERFFVGPEMAAAAYEKEIRSALGDAATVARVYARDFWDDVN